MEHTEQQSYSLAFTSNVTQGSLAPDGHAIPKHNIVILGNHGERVVLNTNQRRCNLCQIEFRLATVRPP